jgi:hypothetical protein
LHNKCSRPPVPRKAGLVLKAFFSFGYRFYLRGSPFSTHARKEKRIRVHFRQLLRQSVALKSFSVNINAKQFEGMTFRKKMQMAYSLDGGKQLSFS